MTKYATIGNVILIDFVKNTTKRKTFSNISLNVEKWFVSRRLQRVKRHIL